MRGIDEACARGAAVINLSLGTSNAAHRSLLEAAVGRATACHAIVVAAVEEGSVRWLPGSLDGVIGVQLDWDCPREAYRVIDDGDGRRVIARVRVSAGYSERSP